MILIIHMRNKSEFMRHYIDSLEIIELDRLRVGICRNYQIQDRLIQF